MRPAPAIPSSADVEAALQADAEAGGVLASGTGAFLESFLRRLEAKEPRTRTEVQAPDSAPASTEGGRFLPGALLVGRYRIVSLLGRGGMGEVYRADDLKLREAVALKFLPERLRREPAFLQRLLDEAKLARQVGHPNVCRVYDVGEAEGRHFLSMEYVDGEDLASLLHRIGRLPWEKALDVARQLCAGLAAAAEHLDEAAVSGGTPAYMAPEQLEGQPASAKSDVYALGLVLYELFTGRRAFEPSTVEELRRQQESTPASPRTLIEGFDPAVERAIFHCLEPDSALRPASARAVAAALSGGDPLAAALAAGETPSPEMVAAAGPEGGLRPAVAFGTLGATLAMLVVLLLLNDRASVVGWLSWPRSPDALEDNARGILERLGYEAGAIDRARRLLPSDRRYRQYVRDHQASANRWDALRQPGQRDIVFWYRQAGRQLLPFNWRGVVVASDPAPEAGDASVMTDLRGRLVWLEVQPPDAEPPGESGTPPDWSRLFAEAGLDPARFQPVPPTRNPRVTADTRAAWTGTLSHFGGYPVRLEAAAYRGKPVFFEQVLPWDPYWDPTGVFLIAGLAAYGAFTAARPRRMAGSTNARLAA